MILICISLMMSDVEHLFMSVGRLYVLFGEMPVQVLCQFFNWIVCGGFFGVKLYEFLISLADISFHSVGHLFILLMVSFSVQNSSV